MGRFKDMQADYENGLMHTFDEDRKVCAEHFRDPYLQDYIRKNGYKGKCSYCDKKHTLVLDMKGLMKYIGKNGTDCYSKNGHAVTVCSVFTNGVRFRTNFNYFRY